jgi:hypothetical protein
MKAHTNTCAVCAKPIGISMLMCARHWRLVPADKQRAVVGCYGRWQRHTGPKKELLDLIVQYRNARDAAVASARVADANSATGELL